LSRVNELMVSVVMLPIVKPATGFSQLAHSSKYEKLCPVHRGSFAMSGT